MVKNNGWISQSFQLSRGIRQGCPVSALLFIVTMEIMALNIKQSNSIKGIEISLYGKTNNVKIKQYADDSILFLRDLDQIDHALDVMNTFRSVSGLKLNLNKTEGLGLGIFKNVPENFKEITWPKMPIRCLGIYIGHNKGECYKRNWLDKIDKLQQLLDRWRTRSLTLFGKIIIIKALCISQLVFSAINTQCKPDDIDRIGKLLYSFLWDSDKTKQKGLLEKRPNDRIKRSVILNDKKEGGLYDCMTV